MDGKPRRSQSAWEAKVKDAKLPMQVAAALQIKSGQRDENQKKAVRDYYLRKINEEAKEVFGLLETDLAELAEKRKAIEDAIPYTLVSEEMAKPRPAFVLIRGDFQNKGERVERGVPAFLPPMPDGAPTNRLGLARWLTRPIIRSPPASPSIASGRRHSARGSSAPAPTLAARGITRRIRSCSIGSPPISFAPARTSRRSCARSSSRRPISKSAAHTAQGDKLDPGNRLLHRLPRYRLGAEELRDNALAIAGLLNCKIGGPSFMPYQPPDFYKYKNEVWTWTPSTGAEQYRRGVYAFWRRTALHPMFAILDAPSREECNIHRARTNTPLQALVTLNDPTFVEAARVFAQKILTQGPPEHDARLAFAFRSATGRKPSDAEMKILRERYRQQHDRFRADADAASKLVNVGQYPREAQLDVAELAAWTAYCNMVLNLDEVLTRE